MSKISMKKLAIFLALICMTFPLGGCSKNAEQNNYENTDEKNIMEDTYEDDMGNPENELSSISSYLNT